MAKNEKRSMVSKRLRANAARLMPTIAVRCQNGQHEACAGFSKYWGQGTQPCLCRCHKVAVQP